MLFLDELEQPILRLKGIGPQSQKDFARLGIFKISHLLRHYPTRYENRKELVSFREAAQERPANTIIRVLHQEWVGGGYKKSLKVWVEDGTEQVALLCFGRDFLQNLLTPGKEFRFFGQLSYKYNELQCSSFEVEEKQHPRGQFDCILPLYPLSGKLQQKTLRKVIKQALNEWLLHIEDEMPQQSLKQNAFPSMAEAVRLIHLPDSMEQIEEIRKYLIYQEWFHLHLTIGRKIQKQKRKRSHKLEISNVEVDRVIKELPFELTVDQKKTFQDIEVDLSSPYPMNRLVQGEVGSGKTLIAFLAALLVLPTEGQTAFMAPTELLAKQHYQNSLKYFPKQRCALLTGQSSKEDRDRVCQGLLSGSISLVIGTHALFSEHLDFRQLELVIVDEQHRFGVMQRLSLIEKGSKPHLLMMTATPIPRTLAITAFGDLDISTIKTLPKGRIPITTHLAQKGKESKVFDFIHGELKKGRQAYFVYPLIEESEKMDLRDAESMYAILSEKIFPHYKLALLHSRIAEQDKEELMARFVSGKIDILVATTVVEVGVDVPNATVMVVEQAERFGLSALHQLRGRVGRGIFPSYAFLIYDNHLTEEGKLRLQTMHASSDGFEIANRDLEIRGAGDITGIKQSGFMKFHIAELGRDNEIMEQARKDAVNLLSHDSSLLNEENRILKELFERAAPFSDNLISRG